MCELRASWGWEEDNEETETSGSKNLEGGSRLAFKLLMDDAPASEPSLAPTPV